MTQRGSILVLEDDNDLQFLYKEILGSDYDIVPFTTLNQFKSHVANIHTPASLVIADLRLPDGIFLDYLRSDLPNIDRMPYIVVSSSDDLDTLRDCYSKGAVDFLSKPFGKNELMLKVERAIKQARAASITTEFTLDTRKFTVQRNTGTEVELTAKEFQLFSVLYHSPCHKSNRTDLVAKIWGKSDITSKTLDVHLHNLRSKIKSLGLKINYIQPREYILTFSHDVH